VERVGVECRQPGRIGLEVRVSRRLVGQHLQGDRVRLGQVGHPAVDRVVQGHPALFDELHQQGTEVGERDRAVAEVHVRGGRDAVHRRAERLPGQHLIALGHLHDDRPEVAVRHPGTHGVADPGLQRRIGRGGWSDLTRRGRRLGTTAAGRRETAESEADQDGHRRTGPAPT
jgi:hypothetical protein